MQYRFLIHISYAYGIPIGKPLEAEILRRGYAVRWFVEEDETLSHLSGSETVLPGVKEVIQYDPHIVLCASNTVPDFFPGIKVQVFHGFSVGKRAENIGHFRIRGLFDLYCTQGPSTTGKFEELAKEHGHFEVVETGWSKVDPLFPLDKTVKSEKPAVLVSSTFTPRLSLAHSNDVFNEIKRLSSSGKYQWMVVLHPKMDEAIVRKFKNIQSEHLSFHDTVDLIPLFKKADIMLADTTSAIYEFLLQEKPVVTYRNNRPGNHLYNIINPEEIGMAIESVLQNPDDLILKIKGFIAEMHPYTDGKSSERIVDTCVDFYENKEKYVSGRKPLNIIRKMQARLKHHYYRF
ncbi:MAG: CDP-glycerol glycerophosphotransferase family protein [Bacteroidetes bacterium]|nr:CDP-glycerol glycerophosphotransferase family protein [Bacteroidota bacterium]